MVDLAISALLHVLRDPKQSSKWRRALLKIFKAISVAFSRDGDFVDVARMFVEQSPSK